MYKKQSPPFPDSLMAVISRSKVPPQFHRFNVIGFSARSVHRFTMNVVAIFCATSEDLCKVLLCFTDALKHSA